MAALDLHIIAQYSALRIIESLAEGTVIFAFAALLLRLVPRQNAGTKSAIWFSALLAIAFAPVVTGIWSSQVPQSGMGLIRPAITVPDAWALYLFGAWAILAAWFLVGVGRALWHIWALKKSCAPVDVTALASEIREVLSSDSNGRVAKLCTSEQVRVPTAIGLLNPVIAVPRWAIDELQPAELKQVLIHEMAHLRRRDDWTNLVQQLVKAVFFFHPAVWWIERKVSLEREIACDDAVLAEIESPRAYAECLAHLAERTFIQRSVALAQAVLGKIRQTSTRVAQILDRNRPRETRTWKPAVSLVAGFAIMFSIGASKFQRLIAFQDESPAQIARGTDPIGANAGSAHPAFVHDAALHTARSIKPTQARLVTRAREKAVGTRHIPERRAAKPKVDGMIHLATLRDRIVPVQETVFVVVQSAANPDTESDDSSAIQMWRVTVLRYVVESSSNTIPRKQI
jgi:beta-lactamase regulating signal transducer with metallopeptidase domain